MTFASEVDFATSTDPTILAAGDFNVDGRPDLAVVNYVSTTFSVLLNATTDAANVSFDPRVDFATGSGPYFIAVGDFNEDGKLDVAVANQIDRTIVVFLNTTATGATTPQFATGTPFTTGSGQPSVAVGDLNGDGRPDLVVGNQASSSVVVLLNTTATGASTPSFASMVDVATASDPRVAIGDINGDGKPDIGVTDYASSSVFILLNTTTTGASTPTFMAPVAIPAGSGPAALAVGDLNGDGRPDLAVANGNVGTVSVLLNSTIVGSTTPTFDTEADFPEGAGIPFIELGDFNGDGRPDLAVANSSSDSVTVLLNTMATGAQTPTFLSGLGPSSSSTLSSVALADFNGDGKLDLAALHGSNEIAVFINTGP